MLCTVSENIVAEKPSAVSFMLISKLHKTTKTISLLAWVLKLARILLQYYQIMLFIGALVCSS